MSENTFRKSEDGETTYLTIAVPTSSLQALKEVSDMAYEAYSRGGDSDDEILFADEVLAPIHNLLTDATS